MTPEDRDGPRTTPGGAVVTPGVDAGWRRSDAGGRRCRRRRLIGGGRGVAEAEAVSYHRHDFADGDRKE